MFKPFLNFLKGNEKSHTSYVTERVVFIGSQSKYQNSRFLQKYRMKRGYCKLTWFFYSFFMIFIILTIRIENKKAPKIFTNIKGQSFT
jgi:hypothetical protein